MHRLLLGASSPPLIDPFVYNYTVRSTIDRRFWSWKIGAKSHEGFPAQHRSPPHSLNRYEHEDYPALRAARRASRELSSACPSRAEERPECLLCVLVYLCTSTAPLRCVCCRRLNAKTLKRLRATFKVREYPLEVLRRIVEYLYSRPGSSSFV